MPKIPIVYAPIVRLRQERRHVLLVAWQRRARTWWAQVAWLQRDGAKPWTPVEMWVPASYIERVPGESYRDVPRAPDLPES